VPFKACVKVRTLQFSSMSGLLLQRTKPFYAPTVRVYKHDEGNVTSSFNAVLQCERVKVIFVHAMKSRSGGTVSLSTSALNGGRDQPHAPAVLPLYKEIPVPVGQGTGWSPEPVWMLCLRMTSA
jgi:hypothetical protein